MIDVHFRGEFSQGLVLQHAYKYALYNNIAEYFQDYCEIQLKCTIKMT